MLDDDRVEAVYISLTNEAHLPWITAALQAGKHVRIAFHPPIDPARYPRTDRDRLIADVRAAIVSGFPEPAAP
mgnify:CR=1 FL=1